MGSVIKQVNALIDHREKKQTTILHGTKKKDAKPSSNKKPVSKKNTRNSIDNILDNGMIKSDHDNIINDSRNYYPG